MLSRLAQYKFKSLLLVFGQYWTRINYQILSNNLNLLIFVLFQALVALMIRSHALNIVESAPFLNLFYSTHLNLKKDQALEQEVNPIELKR